MTFWRYFPWISLNVQAATCTFWDLDIFSLNLWIFVDTRISLIFSKQFNVYYVTWNLLYLPSKITSSKGKYGLLNKQVFTQLSKYWLEKGYLITWEHKQSFHNNNNEIVWVHLYTTLIPGQWNRRKPVSSRVPVPCLPPQVRSNVSWG